MIAARKRFAAAGQRCFHDARARLSGAPLTAALRVLQPFSRLRLSLSSSSGEDSGAPIVPRAVVAARAGAGAPLPALLFNDSPAHFGARERASERASAVITRMERESAINGACGECSNDETRRSALLFGARFGASRFTKGGFPACAACMEQRRFMRAPKRGRSGGPGG